ncbi:MAG: N-acetyltransferase family protein [Kiloniellales bacterium]|nr:N-acetyltransferase family protein [Kiloniellales bacterium]
MSAQSFTIRSATLQDAGAIQAIYAPIVERTAISFEDAPPTAEEMARRIARTLEAYPYLVAEQEGRLLGYAYAGPHRARAAYRHSVDVTAYVAEAARGQGVAKALYGALLAALAGAGYHAAFAGIALPNPASEALHKAAGFQLVGVYREVGFKFDRWHDVAWWQRLI